MFYSNSFVHCIFQEKNLTKKMDFYYKMGVKQSTVKVQYIAPLTMFDKN